MTPRITRYIKAQRLTPGDVIVKDGHAYTVAATLTILSRGKVAVSTKQGKELTYRISSPVTIAV